MINYYLKNKVIAIFNRIQKKLRFLIINKRPSRKHIRIIYISTCFRVIIISELSRSLINMHNIPRE